MESERESNSSGNEFFNSLLVGWMGIQADAGSPQANGPKSSESSSLNAPLASAVDQPTPTRSRTARLAERVAAEFLQMFPDGRPAMKVKELTAQVQSRPGFGTVSLRTVEEALRLAWPRSHRTA
jgi:hypothetical protein